MKQSLYVLRHAKSEPWSPGVDDFKRPISARGKRDMAALAGWVSDHLEAPQASLCSSARRTRETLAALTPGWPDLEQHSRFLEDMYGASPGDLHTLADKALSQANRVLMVGHNPGFEMLVCSVLRDADARSIMKMPTGTLAVIDFERGYRRDAGSGVLRHWCTRKDPGSW